MDIVAKCEISRVLLLMLLEVSLEIQIYYLFYRKTLQKVFTHLQLFTKYISKVFVKIDQIYEGKG